MKKITAIVFDIGGTLMEYKNMPDVWTEFYEKAFKHLRKSLNLNISDNDIEKSEKILRSFNPKVNYREIDLPPEKIFKEATAHWDCSIPLNEMINSFFLSVDLVPYIYPDTLTVLEKLKKKYRIAALTDVASGMPDEMHRKYCAELMPYFDFYVSSITCGYRKPNPKGLEDIADHFGIAAHEIIVVGDEEKDIIAAKRFGCESVLVDRKNKHSDYDGLIVKDLNGFAELLMPDIEQ